MGPRAKILVVRIFCLDLKWTPDSAGDVSPSLLLDKIWALRHFGAMTGMKNDECFTLGRHEGLNMMNVLHFGAIKAWKG